MIRRPGVDSHGNGRRKAYIAFAARRAGRGQKSVIGFDGEIESDCGSLEVVLLDKVAGLGCAIDAIHAGVFPLHGQRGR